MQVNCNTLFKVVSSLPIPIPFQSLIFCNESFNRCSYLCEMTRQIPEIATIRIITAMRCFITRCVANSTISGKISKSKSNFIQSKVNLKKVFIKCLHCYYKTNPFSMPRMLDFIISKFATLVQRFPVYLLNLCEFQI